MVIHTQESVQSQQEREQQFKQEAPERSLAQRMDALVKANRVRDRRAALKKDMKAGRRSIQDILRNPPDYVETMKLFDLILATPKYGRVKVSNVLKQCQISPSRTISGLSERQRIEIISLLRRR